MNRAQLTVSVATWRSRERKAYKLWKSRQKRLSATDPRRAEAFNTYAHAHDMRKRRSTELSRLAVTHMDSIGRHALAVEEGQRNFAYPDSEHHATFGVGHLLHLGPVTDADSRKWGTPSHPLSDAVVDHVFQKDLAKYELAVRTAIRLSRVRVTQSMFNAMVSLCFNIGIGGFITSSVVRNLLLGRKQAAADAFLKWAKPAVLLPRRERERVTFLKA
jgi:GH24 family phage-related lysozyme (muramidase)